MSEENQQPEGKWSSEDIILGRLALVGERLIPREEFANLSQQDWLTWLCEPNPDKFPPSLEHLKKYFNQLMDPDEDLDLDLEEDQEEDLDQEP